MPDYNQLSDFKLKLGYWVVTNKIIIKRTIFFILFAFDVVVSSFVVYRIIQFYSAEKIQYNKTISNLEKYNIDYATYQQKIAPAPIQLLELDAVNLGDSKYNFVAKVRNTNIDKWIAKEISYYFLYNNQKTETKTAFVLPGEEKYLGAFNVESQSAVLKPQLIIKNTKWRRIKPAELAEFKEKVRVFTDFTVDKTEFLTATDLGLEPDSRINAIRFTTTNNTIFDYYDVSFFVVTYSGPIITSANYLTLNDFYSKETRESEIRWHNVISKPSLIVVTPEVDFFDETVIMSKSTIR